MKVRDKVILITGGTSGIGWALAKRLIQLENKVIIMGRDSWKLDEAKKKGFHTINCDLGNSQQVEATIRLIQKEFADLDMLFNNAGIQFNYDFTQDRIPVEKIHQEIQVNVTGQLILTQGLLPLLKARKQAWIINTTSGLGMFPKRDGLVYSVSKAAMRNFTIGIRYFLKGSPVKVLEFIPPVTETNMTAGRPGAKMDVEKLVDMALPQIEREFDIITVGKLRIFRWIAFLLPGLAHKILSKNS